MTVRAHDFRALRHWDGSQHRAFEELCYQLRDATPDGGELVKTGDPDGGLEWYVTLRNGTQWGVQAKYTFDIDTALGLMERSLRTVVKKRPKCRKLTFCIPFDLPDAPGNGPRKSARQKFEDRKESWRRRIPGADRVRVELWSAGDLLERLVGHASQRGIERFFWDQEVFSPDWCANQVATTHQAAGERYSPELHVDLPIAFALEGLALSEAYWKKFRAVRGAVVIAATHFDVSHYTGLGVTPQLRRLVQVRAEWRRNVPDATALPARLDRDRLLAATTAFREVVNEAYPADQRQLQRKETKREAIAEERRHSLRHDLRTLGRKVAAFEALLRGPAVAAAECGALLLTGEAGQGKTHLFCDVAARAVRADRPAIVLLAGCLSGRHVWREIAGRLGLGDAGRDVVIGAMQATAQASNAPFLVLIDALNEAGDPKAWQTELPALLAEVARTPWIALGLSVRSTYRPVVLPPDGLSGVVEIEHRGFERRELEATDRFFDAFGLDHPRIPLLAPEFTNPLFLKLYCEGLQERGLRAPSASENHVSGVFERYLTSRTARIASRLDLDPATRQVEEAIDAFCNALAIDNRDSLPRDQSAQIIDAFAPDRDHWPDTLLGQLLAEGVLAADIAWRRDAAEHVEVIRFTYQRFADFRVASAFLEPLNVDADRLREALATGQPLRQRVLKAPAGWVEALTVLVPERFGIELLHAANWRLDPFKREQWERAFVQSVSTRRPSAVTQRTRALMSDIASKTMELNDLARETLLRVAPLPQHPLNDVLHESLKSWPMPERDVAWSVPTYFAMDDGGSLDRLIRWAARGPYPKCPDQVLELAAVPIVWTFTSPNRRMRDYATKALAKILSGNLTVLPSLIRRFDGVDDPYVIERLAIASHGAVLCGGRKAPQAAVAVAKALKTVALAEAQNPHILTRDAVRGVHEWCFRHELIEECEYAKVLPPYSAEPPGRSRTETELSSKYDLEKYRDSEIRWPYSNVFMSIFSLGDFGRYVIESKVRNFSGHPLASDRPSQGKTSAYPADVAKCWVFERVLSLGWTPAKFGEFDRNWVPRRIYRAEHKPERFGKKYQWIAMRELLARIADNFHMAGGYDGEPVGYAGPWQFFGRDIDPTLPAPTWGRNEDDGHELDRTFVYDRDAWWIPQGPSYGADDPPPGEDWATERGDMPEFTALLRKRDPNGVRWVVLHSYHNWDEEVPADEKRWQRRSRGLWSHVYSWLVRPNDLDALVGHIEERSLMGRWMPEGAEHVDAGYLGELPWAEAAGEDFESWQMVRDGESYRPIGIEVYPAWTEYHWEGNVLDCSIEESVFAFLPAPVLFKAGRLRWVPGSRTWSSTSGGVMARYNEATGHRALLVREDWLKRVLRNTCHGIAFGWLGEKRLFEAGLTAGLVGDWTEMSAVASLAGGRWTFREPRFTRRSVGQ